MRAFRAFSNSWKSSLYIVVIIRPRSFESRIHKVAIEPPEWLAGVQIFVLLLLQIYLVQRMQPLASTIVSNVQSYCDEIHFSICILALTITRLQRFKWPKDFGLVIVGGVWAQDCLNTCKHVLSYHS